MSSFIVLEGPDGSGTTTHLKLLAKSLRSKNIDVLETCEPTDGPIGKLIRELLQKKDSKPDVLQLLFTADRAWHLHQTVLPALKEGKTVLSDRYWLSTYVYARALGLDPLPYELMNKKFIQPSVQLVFLPPFEICLERLGQRENRDIMETDSLQKKVYDGYKAYAEEHGMPIIDSSGNVEDVAKQILKHVSA